MTVAEQAPSSKAVRRLLIVVHAFPPMPRILKFARHLPDSGWQPTVLAPRQRSRGDDRFGGARSLPGLEVHETFFLPAPENAVRAAVGLLRPAGRAAAVGPAAANPQRTAWWHLPRRLLLWTSTPDDLVGWLPWALWRGSRLIRKNKIDAILSSGPPFTTVLAGGLLARLARRPFVADFRDAWVQDPVDPFGCVGGSFLAPEDHARRAVLARLERGSLARAQGILFTSDYTRDAYVRAYPDIAERSIVLYNGVEESDFVQAAEPSAGFSFGYVGTLHDFQREQVLLFLRAFALALRREPGMAGCLVRICGQRPASIDAEIEQVARELGIEGQLRREGAVPHGRAVSLLKGTRVLLLFAGVSPFIRPSKLSDYLAVRRPILALAVRGSEAARHVELHGQSLYTGDSPPELADLLLALWRAQSVNNLRDESFPFPYPHQLNWRSSAAHLAATLDGLCGFRQATTQCSL